MTRRCLLEVIQSSLPALPRHSLPPRQPDPGRYSRSAQVTLDPSVCWLPSAPLDAFMFSSATFPGYGSTL